MKDKKGVDGRCREPSRTVDEMGKVRKMGKMGKMRKAIRDRDDRTDTK
jgi:hypothetical protein